MNRMSKFGKDINVPSRKGVFIPDITVEMFRNASLEGVEGLLESGEMEDISLPPAQPKSYREGYQAGYKDAQSETAERTAETAQNVSDEDLISRKAAIDAIRASTSKYTGFMEMEMYTDDDAVEAIEALLPAQPKVDRMTLVVEAVNTLINSAGDSQSAKAFRNAGKFVKNAIDGEPPTFEEILEEPERKHGKWEFYEDRAPVWDIAGEKTWARAYKCSECGFVHSVIEDFGRYVFCPNCGADMREDEQE